MICGVISFAVSGQLARFTAGMYYRSFMHKGPSCMHILSLANEAVRQPVETVVSRAGSVPCLEPDTLLPYVACHM